MVIAVIIARGRDGAPGAKGAAMGLYGDHVLPHIINVAMNTGPARRIRSRVCEGLKGDVVEIGFGTGHNLPFLPPTVTRLCAVEPSHRSVALARRRIEAAPFEVDVVGLDGQRIPLDDASADAVLCTWVLCTIPDPIAAIREVRRVLRPGGELRFVEHGRAPDAGVRAWQDRMNGLQQRIAGGCNLNRDIPDIIRAGGLTITSLDTYYNKGEPKFLGSMFEGVAAAA